MEDKDREAENQLLGKLSEAGTPLLDIARQTGVDYREVHSFYCGYWLGKAKVVVKFVRDMVETSRKRHPASVPLLLKAAESNDEDAKDAVEQMGSLWAHGAKERYQSDLEGTMPVEYFDDSDNFINNLPWFLPELDQPTLVVIRGVASFVVSLPEKNAEG